MLGPLVSSELDASFHSYRSHNVVAPFPSLHPLHFACSTNSDTCSNHSYSSCSTYSYGSSGTDVTSSSSGSTTRRSSCETNVSSYQAGNNSKPHKAQDLAWSAIRSLKLRGEEISMTHLKLLCKLGQGDIGSVYLAQLRGTSCLFAMKVVDKEKLGKKNKVQRMHTEREILELVDHPFLPTLYAHFDMGQFSCLLTEFCPGGDLHALRHRQPGKHFGLKLVRFYAAQVLVALEYLHMLGIVYRDLKPENVLVREDGHIMLTDFDLCVKCEVIPALVKLPASSISSRSKRRLIRRSLKSTQSTNQSGSSHASNSLLHSMLSCICPWGCRKKAKKRREEVVYPELVAEPMHIRSMSMVGTHEYLAPEVVAGWGHGSAVDWWMLGILVYELLFGRTPFKGSNNQQTLHNIARQQLRFPEGADVVVGEAGRSLIQGLLTKDPRRRLGSARGASEIKQHPFFRGVNWALVRTGKPSFHHHHHHLGPSPAATHHDLNSAKSQRSSGPANQATLHATNTHNKVEVSQSYNVSAPQAAAQFEHF